MTTEVAIFGFGEIGNTIAKRLIASGCPVNVWSRTPEKLLPLVEAGATMQLTEVDNIKSAEIIISTLPDSPSLQEVLFHNDWAHELHGRTIIHFGSLNSSRSQAIMDAFHAHQANYVEVAAMGNREQVNSGDWQLLVGANQHEYETVKPLLADLSSNVAYIGEVGDAVAIKLAMQQITASLLCAFSSSLSLVGEQGVDIEKFMAYLRQSSAFAPLFDEVMPNLLKRDYSQSAQLAQSATPGRHVEADLKLFVEQADELGLTTHQVQSICELIGFSVSRGPRDQDYSAVHDIINPPRE